MFDFEELKKQYEEVTGFLLFMEEGEVVAYSREKNEVVKPIFGRYHVNPISLTSLNSPFIGMATADIQVLAPPDRWEEARDTMNNAATYLNGKSFVINGEAGKKYTVSYNCQTSVVDGMIRDTSYGVGEAFPISQLITYVIIEQGVSAYDVTLKIDGLDVPILTMVETKVHTSSTYASQTGSANTVSEVEAYGCDFTTPYVNSEICEMFREAVDGITGNKAHVVTIEKNGITKNKIMMFSAASNSVQPPQNVGFNISMTEIRPSVASFDWRWKKITSRNKIGYVSFSEMSHLSKSPKEAVVFWGDGSFTVLNREKSEAAHPYTDGIKKHDIFVFRWFEDPDVTESLLLTIGDEKLLFDPFGSDIMILFDDRKIGEKILFSELNEKLGAIPFFYSNEIGEKIITESISLNDGISQFSDITGERIFDFIPAFVDENGESYIPNGFTFKSIISNIEAYDGLTDLQRIQVRKRFRIYSRDILEVSNGNDEV